MKNLKIFRLLWMFSVVFVPNNCQRVADNQAESSRIRRQTSNMDSMYSTSEFREACPSGETGDFAYSGDCRKYLSCWKGRGVLRLCSPGTLFNPDTLECDFPDKVSCHSHVKRSGRSEGSHWHSNPMNFISDTGSDGDRSNGYGRKYPNYNGHSHHHVDHRYLQPGGQPYPQSRPQNQQTQIHHNHGNFQHSPEYHARMQGRGWTHHHHHHHHGYHSNGFNGLPTYTPPDKTNLLVRNRTSHIGVQPPPIGWRNQGSDNVQPAPSQIYENCVRTSYGNGSECEPPAGTNSQTNYARRTPQQVPFQPNPNRGTQRYTPRFPASVLRTTSTQSPADQDEDEQQPEDIGGLLPPNQNAFEDLPFCDELDESASAPASSSTYVRRSRYIQQPPTALCPQGFSGLTAHPDCTKFLSCANGRTFVMDCGPGTRFHPTKLICDHAEKVKCGYENPYDLYPAGSTVRETHQPIQTVPDRRDTSIPDDYDFDVRIGGNSVRCRPRNNQFQPNNNPQPDRPNYRNVGQIPVDGDRTRPSYQFQPNNNPQPDRPNYRNVGQIPVDKDQTRPSYPRPTYPSQPAPPVFTTSPSPASPRQDGRFTKPSQPSPNYRDVGRYPVNEDSSPQPSNSRPSFQYPTQPTRPTTPSKPTNLFNTDSESPRQYPVYAPRPSQPQPNYVDRDIGQVAVDEDTPKPDYRDIGQVAVEEDSSQPDDDNYDSQRPTSAFDTPWYTNPNQDNRPATSQFQPNYVSPPTGRKVPNEKDKTKERPKYHDPPLRIPAIVQPSGDPLEEELRWRLGNDQDSSESTPKATVRANPNLQQNIRNEYEVITAKPIVVTGRSVRTKTTTAEPTTTSIQPTKQHVFRLDDVTTPPTRPNTTITIIPDWQVLRLRGGPSPLEGFVEIQIKYGAWGILCDQRNQWSLEEANLVCKNLGYSRGADQSWQGKPAEGRISKSSVIAANNVRCFGHEQSILECYISGGGNCDIERDAIWIRCHPNSVSACQPGETSFDGKCYSLVVPDKADSDATVGFSQGEALAHCRSKGGRLVDLTSQQENDYLSEWLVFSNSADSVMTSGVGVSVMGHPLWIWEGSEDSFSYKNWWPGWGGGNKGVSPTLNSGRALCVVARRYFPCSSYQIADSLRPNTSEIILCDSEYFFWDIEDCGAMSSSHPYICERPADKVGCVLANGESYSGPANVSGKGVACLSWDNPRVLDRLQYKISQDSFKKSLSGHNSCRNVGGVESLPWCYAETDNVIQKQLCDVPKCGKGVQPKSASFVEYVCKEDEFSCQFNSECIPKAWKCDGQQDCTNGADEMDCQRVVDKFTKFPGKRLYGHDSEKWLRTSASSCAQRCTEATSFQCRSFSHSENTMECLLSDSNIGLSGSVSGNDTTWDYYELNTLTIHCTQHFLCDNGKCISPELVCNGHNDCNDQSDERNCTWNDSDIKIRLTGDSKPERGTVEVKFKDEWGLICDDEFDMEDGRVICRQLGYSDVADILKHSVGLSNVNNLTKYMLDNVKCLGNETNVAQCGHNGWGVHDCAPTETVGLVCTNGSTGGTSLEDNEGAVASNMWRCETTREVIHIDFLCDNVPDCSDKSDEDSARCRSAIEVRLVGVSRSSRPEGRLEVRRFGVWGTVCDDDFGSVEAQVVCSTLGHNGPAKAYKNAKFGAGTGVIWMDSVHCTGNETGVERCLHEGWGKTNCKHDEDVSVVCQLDLPLEGVVDASYSADGESDGLPQDCGHISQELASPSSRRFSARVVSGFETIKGTYPWQASVRLKSAGGKSAHWCGAVVIARRYALTAGHCLRDYVKSHYFIRTGDFDTQTEEGTEQDLEIEEMWIHEELDSGARLNNDIAVVRVKPPGFEFNTWVQPACLPKSALPKDKNCTISGWGTTSAPGSGFARTLHAAWLTPLNKQECSSERVYGPDALSAGMFCAGSLTGGADSCQGDSGGPFVCPVKGRHTVYGITSWGHGCGRVSSPGVYTDLWYYNKWITDTLAKSIAN